LPPIGEVGQDPNELFDKVAEIQLRYSETYNMEDALATILRAAPKEYAGVIAATHLQYGNNMTEEQIRHAMSLCYRSDIYGMNNKYVDGDAEKEVQLGNVDNKKKDGRKCFKCHEQGHIAAQCPKKRKCEICDGPHATIACWDDPRNAHRRPAGFVSKLTEEQREKLRERSAATVDKAVHLANIDMTRPCEKKEDDGPSIVIGKSIEGQEDECESCESTSGSVYLTDGNCIDVHSNNFKYLGFDGENDVYEYWYDSITSDGGCELKTGYVGIPCPVKHYETWPSPAYGYESEDDESSGPPPLVPRRVESSSDDESVDEWFDTMDMMGSKAVVNAPVDYKSPDCSVHTMTAAELLMSCATMDASLDVNDDEIEKAIEEVDNRPPYQCTRSHKTILAKSRDMTVEEIKKHNRTRGKKIRDDSKFEQLYKDAEKLQRRLEIEAQMKEDMKKIYGVEDIDEYLHQRSMDWGYAREVESEDIGKLEVEEGEEAYSFVKPTKKRGKDEYKKLVKIVHKRTKSM
jgi:hypothetical protein